MQDRIKKFPELIAFVESGYDPHALRFEEYFYRILKSHDEDINKVAEINVCSKNTARMICATSWGLYQLLGYNIYINLGYDDRIFNFLKDLTLQLEYFKNFVKRIAVNESYDTFVGNIISELEMLFNFDIKADPDYLKKIYRKNKDRLTHLTRFVYKYNGARVGTEAFYAYIRRMMLFYDRVYM